MSRSVIYITGRKQACVMSDGHTEGRAARRHIGTNSVALLLERPQKKNKKKKKPLWGADTQNLERTQTQGFTHRAKGGGGARLSVHG